MTGDSGGPDHVIKAVVASKYERGLALTGTTATGQKTQIAITIVAPGMARVLVESENPDPNRTTLARDVSNQPVKIRLEELDGQINLISEFITVQIKLNPFHLAFFGPGGQLLLDQNSTDRDAPGYLTVLPFGSSSVNGQQAIFHDTFNIEPDEHFYGFGEKFTNFDKRGQRLEMWAYDAYGVHTERAYKPVPFFISSRGYGVFVDSVSRIEFDMAHSNHSTFSLIVPDSALDYYVITGPDPKKVITRYASLVSYPTLPPKWAFGLWMSSGFQRDSAAEVLLRSKQIRDNDLPCDVLHLDCYWQKHGRWSDMVWDEELFPHPEQMIEQVKAQNLKICLWINPYIGIESPRFTEAKERGYFLKKAQGDVYVADLWGGNKLIHPPVGIIDMTNPQATTWFAGLLRPLLQLGIDVLKTDFGEGVPADAVAYNGMTGEQLHNLYPLLYNDLVSEVTAEETGRPGLVWGRSTYAGGQRHAAQWGGDARSTYQGLASTLRGGLSLGMSGHPFWSHDIGGFHLYPDHRPTPDLFIRWAQFGLFSSLSRNHGVATRLPWDYGEEALRIFRDYARLRYRLLPYIYTYASIAAETSLPIMRPMVLEFPDDPNTYAMDLQYMFGEELLVAPIYNISGRRPVYFPAGQWIDFWTRDIIAGPTTHFVEAPLELMPLYVKANALIPTVDSSNYLTDAPFEQVTFDAYLLDQGRFVLRDNDGLTQVEARLDGTQLMINGEGAKDRLYLRLIPVTGVPPVDAVKVNGTLLDPSSYSPEQDGTLRIPLSF
jgi:alpha-D-xyloside xylohydrolase